ncbi:MAG: nucleotidyltransferase family protein, partial [Ferruginibacter sp.]
MTGSNNGVVILAAGASTRLGEAKQLLLYKGKSLLRHAIDLAVETGAKPVVTVLGANADQLIKEATQAGNIVLVNNEWKEGMASSIRNGLKELLKINPDVQAVILIVCDQPFVTKELLQKLVKKYESSDKPMVACSYDNSIGTPALFDRTIFASLLELEGDSGAKKILKASP